MSHARGQHVVVRPTGPGDFAAITEMCRMVYPWVRPWQAEQLQRHVDVFPEGQMVAVEKRSGKVLGMTASLIIHWDDYDIEGDYHDFTARGTFANHDPERGRTLYGAEVMVHPGSRGRGVGKKLYSARRRLVRRLELTRIRAGARMRGYHRHAGRLSAEAYAAEVACGRIRDPTITFQLRQGFRIIGVVHDYDVRDPESMGHAAIIEWINPEVAGRLDVPRVPAMAPPLHGQGPSYRRKTKRRPRRESGDRREDRRGDGGQSRGEDRS